MISIWGAPGNVVEPVSSNLESFAAEKRLINIPGVGGDTRDRLQLKSLFLVVERQVPELKLAFIGEIVINSARPGTSDNQRISGTRRPGKRGRSGDIS